MKKFIPLLLFSAAIISLCLTESCKKSSSLTACIGTLPSAATAGLPVTFTSCTSGAASYAWSFGDNTTGSGDTVAHTYASAGSYNGSLTVTSGGSSSTKNFTITVINNSWSFKGSNYATDSVVTSGITLFATGYSASGRAVLDFVFSALPTASGNYTVVNAANSNVGAGQVAVTLYAYPSGGGETIYGSTGSGTIDAEVTLSNGKLSIYLPAIEIVNASNPSDSSSFNASITQTH